MNFDDLRLRLRALILRNQTEQDLQDELNFHIEMLKRKHSIHGLQEEEAARIAHLKFGPVTKVAEDCRDARGVTFVTEVIQDLRYAFAAFARKPGFTGIAILTLALGIGANTAIFSVVNAVLLRPLTVPDADRLVRLNFRYRNTPLAFSTASLPQFNVLRKTTDIFDDISAYRLDFSNTTVESNAEQLPVARVTANFFRLFGAPVIRGRTFTVDEDRPGGDHVAVLSYNFAVRSFGNYKDAAGRSIFLGGEPYQVIGVLGPAFETEQFHQNPDIWIPFQINPETQDVGGEFVFIAARLKPGETIAEVRERLEPVTDEYRKTVPGVMAMPGGKLDAIPLREAMVAQVKAPLVLLFGAVSLVLLIACTNVSNLLLIQATGRKRELAIRAALGASRWRLVRQLLTESGLLAFMGGAMGLVVGIAGVRFALAWYPENNPFLIGSAAEASIPRVAIDWRVVAFTLSLSFLATILFGLLPALKASRTDVYDWLKQAGHTSTGGIRQNKARSFLVVAEMAMALTLLIGAILLIRTSTALQAVDPGFDPTNVLTLRMAVTGTRFDKRDGIEELTRTGTERIRALPGVLAASTTCCVPLELVWQLPFTIVGRPNGKIPLVAEWTFISPQYFDVFKIPIVRGRDFTDHDDARSPGVVIINETMAHMFWPKTDPLNDSLIIGRGVRPDYLEDPIRRIVGIVGDVRDQALKNNPRPEMYVPVGQEPDGVTSLNVRLLPLTWVVRTRAEPHSLTAAIQKELKEASGGLPVGRVRSMEQVHTESTARTRFVMWLMTLFGCCALALAIVGVYSVTAYSVEQRTREIGVRLSLGATPNGVRNMVILQAFGLGILGIVIGNAGAILLTRILAGILYGVTATDPTTYVGASLLLSATVLVAVSVPARLATRVSPSLALRYE